MTALRVISLAQNQLTGVLPGSLDALQKLEALSLADQVSKGGGITGPLTTFRFHPFLQSLQLSRNLLEGTIPVQLLEGTESLNNILKVGLADNQLTGEVPGGLARFQRMNLDLEGNRLTTIDERLCANSDWMDGLVGAYGCDAILCPAGFGGGKQKFDDAPCQNCPTVSENIGGTSTNWMGQKRCYTEFAIDEENDEQGLMEMLFQQAGGEKWSKSNNWMQQVHVCEWYGISCDQSKSIVGITLGANNLHGNLPTEIFMLPNLEMLSVFGNDKLDISLAGIANARNLRSLVLDSTNLKSIQGIGKARSLTELDVRNNDLKGTLPEEFGRLINLRSLSVSSNGFEGTIPYWIYNLPSLETFLAAENKLGGTLPAFSTFKKMTYVDLSKNELSGEIPSSFLEAVDIDEKVVGDLSSNNIEGSVPQDLSRLGRLTIHLQDNRITGIDPELCSVEGWNDFDVERFGCDGILCPVGSSSINGRQTSDTSMCTPCKDAEYMGSTACHVSAASRTSNLAWSCVTLIATYFLATTI